MLALRAAKEIERDMKEKAAVAERKIIEKKKAEQQSDALQRNVREVQKRLNLRRI